MATSGRESLLSEIYSHVVLPRDVPGQEHRQLFQVESDIASRFTEAAKLVISHAPLGDFKSLDVVRLALSTCKSLHVDGKVDKHLLLEELGKLEAPHALILHVTEQNAALLIYAETRDDGSKYVVFEAFETSATSESVLATENALQWDFPGQAIKLPMDVFSRDDFQRNLTTFIEQASIESVRQFAAVTYKACAPLPEIRDTPAPSIVTELLMTILGVSGTIYHPRLLRKRVRDTVSFCESRKPWRRSAFYLVLRVAVQRFLYRLLGVEKGRLYYKIFMCIFMTKILDDTIGWIPQEAVHNLRQKLGRRLSKLEVDQERASCAVKDCYLEILRPLSVLFQKSLSTAATMLDRDWEEYKRKTIRIVRPIDRYATVSDMTLRLPNSGDALRKAMTQRYNTLMAKPLSADQLLGQYMGTSIPKPFIALTHQHYSLFSAEEKLSTAIKDSEECSHIASCIQLAGKIKSYIATVDDAYCDYPEFKSRQLLYLMELWMHLDQRAVRCYPQLADYHPVFEASMLDVLELSTLEELKRVAAVQSYIEKRGQGWSGRGSRTIFDSPAEDAFAVRYYNASPDSIELLELRQEIEEDAQEALESKEAEWREKSQQHKEKAEQIAALSCVYITVFDENGYPEQVHQKGCHKHRLKWEAKQIKIDIFEYPLPNNESALKAVVFELACPEAFAAYRDATWAILSSFAYPRDNDAKDAPLLRSYVGLEDFANTTQPVVTLASSTKSHLESHYKTCSFPTTLTEVCRSFALKLDYFDSKGNDWTRTIDRPSFAHLFPLKISTDSPFAFLANTSNFAWPTSNRALAAQNKCPADFNVHEYIAGQCLLSGTYVRWPNLLREMGATNINFSSDSSWAIISRLILQVGPKSSMDKMRDVHCVFRDQKFCEALCEQIDYRLETIRRNWREPVQLDLLLSMLIKIKLFAPDANVCATADSLIIKSRVITQGWCMSLRSTDNEQALNPTIFAMWAAVLCKRTFYPYFDDAPDMSRGTLEEWITASVTLQNSLVGSFDTLPYNLRNALLRDLMSAYGFRDYLREAIKADHDSVLRAVEVFWPVPSNSTPTTTVNQGSWWIKLTLDTISAKQQHIHYHVVDGTLLINGQPLGMLPPEYRRWPIMQELFGNLALDTYPSSEVGMSLVLSRPFPFGYWVHLGMRDDCIVLRAQRACSTFELIDRDAFKNDLPSTLIANCYHWLDLTTGVLEIRQQDPWKSKKSNWQLSLYTRRATRNNRSTLVDPNCELASRVAQNFQYFEYPKFITVYQPATGNLRVELKRLELDFVVTQAGYLLCPQLQAVVAETRNQDVGTWYGLNSKLVVKSLRNSLQRSILLPTGQYVYHRQGPHVSVVLHNNGGYLKFDVNHVLGRIDCPAEPVIMYQRALWHALTAYILPDSLTGRTGLEEALRYLHLAASLPWMPLSMAAYAILSALASMSPQRTYYPADLKTMETVKWDPARTIYMQDDRYRRAVERIVARSAELAQFAQVGSDNCSLPNVTGNEHLEDRAIARMPTASLKSDSTYASRDHRGEGTQYQNVATTVRLLKTWPKEVTNTNQLPQLLEQFPVIGGYTREFDKIQFTDILTTDLGVDWGALVTTSIASSEAEKYNLIFLLASLAFATDIDMELVQAIASFALLPDLKSLVLPRFAAYGQFQSYQRAEQDELAKIIERARKPYAGDSSIPESLQSMRQLDHEKRVVKACADFATSMCAQWPSLELDLDRLAAVPTSLLDRDQALALVLPEWKRLVANHHFSKHLEELQLTLQRYAPLVHDDTSSSKTQEVVRPQLYPLRMRGGELPQLGDLLEKAVITPPSQFSNELQLRSRTDHNVLSQRPNGTRLVETSERKQNISPYKAPKNRQSMPSHLRELRRIVAPYRQSPSLVHRRFGSELEQSLEALSDRLSRPAHVVPPYNPTAIDNEIYAAKEALQTRFRNMKDILQKNDRRARWLTSVGLWPTVSITSLLAELRSTAKVDLGVGMKEALVQLGLAVTTYQRLLRIRDAAQKDEERENLGHANWSPMQYVDWLLLEIESNILIRPEQVDVALATMSPQSGQNSVLQLLMGKGKTSCILPMVALELGKQNLFRIVVPKPLLLQSAQIMQAKLGGILDREVLHIPFSRRTSTDKISMKTFFALQDHVKRHCGIILALPEHILSFKLSGLQRLCDGKSEEAALMIKIQTWLEKHARDVLDECDVSLAVKTQLIYPSGSQQTVDGHPLRWQTLQQLLDLVASYLSELQAKFPNSIEIVHRAGYPLIYFLRKDAEDYLIDQLVEQISEGKTSILPLCDATASAQRDVRDFISTQSVGAGVDVRIAGLFRDTRHFIPVVYHLRGMFVHRILLSTLKKRWNVQYGLHSARDPIAVPYQAKGVPSPSAEWGHPDVAIILTCLSFYYEGLNLAQFKQTFEQLAKSDEPSIEYSLWVAESVPEALKNYNAVNVEDQQQLRELHHHIRYKVCLLNFYLNSFVFPKYAKQFSKKLSASGSDLVLFDPGRPGRIGTTGFSGTNDTRHQLPATIKQRDLEQLAHTNAEVLAYLVEDRNRPYVRMVDDQRKRLTEEGLLRKLLYPGSKPYHRRIRILLDAGAQILEHDNRSLAKAWLRIDYEAAAAVYFAEDHRAMVIYGKGKDMPLVASPFADNLEECVVYVDESHCRGTDLKLPTHARAAVTLGPHLTKDALVQAAMRLRLLGKTQSVTFFSPPEVHQNILDLRAATNTYNTLSSVDVIRWLLEQTCNVTEQLEPLYFTQGINYLQRAQARIDHPDFIQDVTSREQYLEVVRSKELQTLRQLYEPRDQRRAPPIKASAFASALRPFVNEVLQRKKHFQDRGVAVHATALEEVEQEREMEFEVESVREVQKPVLFKSLKIAALHPEIKAFATSGRVPAGSDAFNPMFIALQKTALGLRHGALAAASRAPRLYLSTQFLRTVSAKEANDNFARPCHWLLWSRTREVGLLVSPEEADQLIPVLRRLSQETPPCHLIVYAAPITRRMLHFNKLTYYAIPPLPINFEAPIWLRVELGLFAGRLYFEWDEYEAIKTYLDNSCPQEQDNTATAIQAFAAKPLTFVHDWLAIRRKGQEFEHTPMGFVTTGKPLFANHPFFSFTDNDDVGHSRPSAARNAFKDEHDDDDSDDDGEDHAKELLFQQEDLGDEDVFHDAEEEFDEEENTFFDGKAYVHEDEEMEKEKKTQK